LAGFQVSIIGRIWVSTEVQIDEVRPLEPERRHHVPH